MYDSLKILRFRAFDAFEIHHLSRVNLIVGKNNAGKTSLLDAVEMMAPGGRVASLLRSPRRRGEVSLEPADEKTRRELDVRHVFWGHEIQVGTSFEVTGIAHSREVKVSCEVRLSRSDQTRFEQLSEQADLETPLEIVMTGPGLLINPATPLIAADRVGLTGLRPSALPHHRTCGFPHPAVDANGLHRSEFRSRSGHLTL